MATYGLSDFNCANYRKYRPLYKTDLYQELYRYHEKHGGKFVTALDIGTGTGQVAVALSAKFLQVHAIDPSSKMLEAAESRDNIHYSFGQGEDLSQFESGTIDIITVSEAFHWLDHSKFFQEIRRVMASQATLMVIGYTNPTIIEYPEASRKLQAHEERIAPLHEKGRKHLASLYRGIDIPFADVRRSYYHPADPQSILRSEMNVDELRNFMKTYGSYKIYCSKYPHEPDVVDAVIESIVSSEQLKDDDRFTVSWNTVVIFAQGHLLS
ncbi:trans-aconitate methyltransferase 1 [Basidiobolus ranarum]|uniref:Trans-aconitate methyltransferase 1 n=1 Tax=Basidiobolus ranarum TaxID=34480 RepID=A0ABR2VS15_9FUNG